MKKEPIEKLFKIIGGKPAPKGANSFSKHGTPFIKMKDLGRAHFSNNLIDIEQKVSDEIAKKNKLKLIKKGAILLPRSGSVALNHRAILGVDAYMVSHICALEVLDEEKLFNQYAYYYLRSIKMDRISKKTTGLDAITFKDLGKIDIPLPQLDDQKRIALLLGKVEGLIAHRQQHLQKLDDLLKSVFLDMFGDPVRNEKGWDKKPFSKLFLNIDSGRSPKCETRKAEENEWGILKLGAVTSCFFKEEENKALPQGITPNTKDEVKSGDLLFSRKNTFNLVAACAYVFNTRHKLLLPDLIFRFVIKKKSDVNPIFLWRLLISDTQRKKIQTLASGAAGSMPNISKAKLKQVLLPIPPLDLQDKFSDVVKKVEGIKSRYQQSLTDLEHLYGALSQKAFKGELDLSRIPLPKEAPEMAKKEKMGPEDKPFEEPLFELPAPTDFSVLQSPKGRKALLDQWITAWVEQSRQADFTAHDFMEAARQRLWELTEDETTDWGTAEYDELKAWVFKALEQGRLTQTHDDADNRVRLSAAKG